MNNNINSWEQPKHEYIIKIDKENLKGLKIGLNCTLEKAIEEYFEMLKVEHTKKIVEFSQEQ